LGGWSGSIADFAKAPFSVASLLKIKIAYREEKGMSAVGEN